MNMMSMISYTSEQEREIERRALMAAWGALASMRLNPEQGHRADSRAILAAFAAVRLVEEEADRHLQAMYPGKECVQLFLNRYDIVANAVMMAYCQSTEVQINPAIGKRMLAFASACLGIEAYSYVSNAINANEQTFNGSGHARDMLTLAGLGLSE